MKCYWCDNEASSYQDWDKGWVSVCLPCHLKDCISPTMHGSEKKRTAIRGAAEAPREAANSRARPETTQ